MTSPTPTPRELAHRLIASETLTGAAPDAMSAAVSRICDQLYRELSRRIGTDGCHALFARALTRAQAGHPALHDIHLRGRSDSCLDGVAESVHAHSATAVAEGLEDMIVALIELLGRLIGDDMASKLIEHSIPRDPGATASRAGEPSNES